MFMNFYVSKELENHCLTAIANIYILHTTDHYKLKICMILVYLNDSYPIINSVGITLI